MLHRAREITLAIAATLTAAATLTGCFVRETHGCREHENWDGNGCHAERGYEHYWDHPDHRDWHHE